MYDIIVLGAQESTFHVKDADDEDRDDEDGEDGGFVFDPSDPHGGEMVWNPLTRCYVPKVSNFAQEETWRDN